MGETSEAQQIVAALHRRGASYASIAAIIGARRETVSNIASGKQSGRNCLKALRQLALAANV